MRLKIAIYFIVLIKLCGFSSTEVMPKQLARIVGGSRGFVGNNPYVVQVFLGLEFICGGALLTEFFVVSAAHCIMGLKPEDLTIVGGVNTFTEPGVTCHVEKIMKPKNFSLFNMNYDVAVFKLLSPMSGPRISPIPLYTGRMRQGMKIKIVGWGLRREFAKVPASHLRRAIIPVVGRRNCKNQYRKYIPVTKTMFCASEAGLKDACTGDSGGPAVYNGTLIGIISYGMGCGRKRYPGVFTKITRVRKFIENCLLL